jgi:hypothetical protein
MGENSRKIRLQKDKFGYSYSLVGVINSSAWRPTRKSAMRAALRAQRRFLRRDNVYRNAEIIDGILSDSR